MNFSSVLLSSYGCPALNSKNLKKIQEVANLHGYFKKFPFTPSKIPIFGNATKIAFLHKVISRVPNLLVPTVCVSVYLSSSG
jgi:hypothetical protein